MRFFMFEPIPGGPQVTIEAMSQGEAEDRFAQLFLDRESYAAAIDSGFIPPTMTCTQVNNGPATDPIAFADAFNKAMAEAMDSARSVAAAMNAVPIFEGTPESRIPPAGEGGGVPVTIDEPVLRSAGIQTALEGIADSFRRGDEIERAALGEPAPGDAPVSPEEIAQWHAEQAAMDAEDAAAKGDKLAEDHPAIDDEIPATGEQVATPEGDRGPAHAAPEGGNAEEGPPVWP